MPRIAIIGAGIGGLTAALALRQAGFDVTVFEQAPELTEVGGGINMSPNALKILHRLGLAAGLDRVGVRPLTWYHRRWEDGRVLTRVPLNPRCEAAYGAPHLTLHRRDLLDVIASGLPGDRIHLGHRLAGFEQRDDGVDVWFENGARVTTDILVGADGIHSAVRSRLFGDEAPLFAGCVAFRSLVPVERIADLGLEVASQSWVGPGGHFVHYFVSGGRLLNFVGWSDNEVWSREDWTDEATVERAQGAFAGWHPRVGRIIGAAETAFIWALFDRDPLPRWSLGRVTLLGDACHPMYPFMAQGAAQAVEDGAALAACLSAGGDVPAALRRYEQVRLPRVSQLQAMSRANKRLFHMPDGPEQQARDAAWAEGPGAGADPMAWLFGHDAGVI